MLQADTKEMFDTWISALQHGIGAAIQRIQSIDTNHSNKRELNSYSNYDDTSGRGKNVPSHHDNNNRTKKRYATCICTFIINLVCF